MELVAPRFENIIIGSQGGGVGDNLQITPIFKYFKSSTIEIINSEYGKNISSLYEGICNFEFKNNPILEIESFSKYGYKNRFHPFMNGAVRYLTIFGIENKVTPIPKVNINEEYLTEIKYKISKYKNPLAIVTYNRGIEDINNKAIQYRSMEIYKWQKIINELCRYYDILHFFSEENPYYKLDNCYNISGLNLYDLKHYFAAIGKLIGLDSGPHHLMIASGGFSYILVPENSWEYQYYGPNWQYTPDMWWDEKSPRVKYYNKDTDYLKILENFK